MIHLFFVGDGKRDAVTVPRIVEAILKTKVREETRPWARLHGSGKGYRRRLAYACRQARDRSADGLVATVDRDRDPPRRKLHALQAGRDADRERSPRLPTALGEAVPHGEAWLLDDPVAVRDALHLSAEADVPTVRKAKNPKAALESLLNESPRSGEAALQVLADIARALDPGRCEHDRATGFRAFVKDVRSELGPLVITCSSEA